MARNPIVATPASFISAPATNELVADMRVTLDAYVNMLVMITSLEERRSALSEEFLKKFSTDIAAQGATENNRFDAGLQKYNEWKKVDEEEEKRIKGLTEVARNLWCSFRKSATAYPEGGAALLSLKIQWLYVHYAKAKKAADLLEARLDELNAALDTLPQAPTPGPPLPAPDPATATAADAEMYETYLMARIGPQLRNTPFDSPEVLKEMIAVAIRRLPPTGTGPSHPAKSSPLTAKAK